MRHHMVFVSRFTIMKIPEVLRENCLLGPPNQKRESKYTLLLLPEMLDIW